MQFTRLALLHLPVTAGNNLSGFASQFATQNIHSCDANLAPSAKKRDTCLRTCMCPGGSTGGHQLDYAPEEIDILGK